MKPKFILFLLFALVLSAGAFILVERNSNGSDVHVLLIGLDGASIDILSRLASENKIPNFQKLMSEGAVGHLDSLSWKKKVSGAHGYFSPIVWSTIATGKTPEKHGVEDFVLPIPDSAQYRMGHDPETETNVSELVFPLHAKTPVTMVMNASAPAQMRSLQLQVKFNGQNVGSSELTDKFEEFRYILPAEDIRWVDNRISFIYGATQKIGPNLVGPYVDYIRLYDSDGQLLKDFHPSRDKELFLSGWLTTPGPPVGQASSYHMRTRNLWEITSKFNRRIGVVGWWATWPAYPVNGFLVSSQVGLQGERRTHIHGSDQTHLDVIPDLTFPGSFVDEIKPMNPPAEQMQADFGKRFFGLGSCGCIGSMQEKIVMERFWQDNFFSLIAQDLMDKHGDFDLFAIYFRGTDTISHQFLGLAENPEYLHSHCDGIQGCDLDRLQHIVDHYYMFIDEQVGQLMKRRKGNTITIVVTDHGEASVGGKGNHKNNGFIIAQGPGIRNHTFQDASVLDIAPTILYLLNMPVGQDMDGNVLKEVFDRDFLERKPLAFIDSYDRIVPASAKKIETNKDVEDINNEEFKAIGYIN